MTTAPPPERSGSRGGLLLTVDGRRFFLRAELTVKLATPPQIARLPGAPRALLGLALSEGAILPVVDVGVHRDVMIVCAYRGEQFGLVGATELRSGVFPAGEGAGVLVEGEPVPPLDLEELYNSIHAVTWAASWGGAMGGGSRG